MDTAAIYVRVSTDEQAGEGHASLEVQRLRCQEYCDRHGWVVAELYQENASAFNGSRPAFQNMVGDAKAHRFQHLVVFNASRFSRRAAETLTVIETLKSAGVQLHSTLEDMTQFLMVGIQGVINEVESRRIGERVRPSLEHLARQGLWPRGHPRNFGFAFHRDKVLRVVPQEAAVVQSLFQRYHEGASLGRLVATMKDQGFSPATVTGIRWLLRNPLYAGRIRWNGQTYPGKHEAIVEPALFDRVQEQLQGRYQHHEPAITEFAVAGMLKCGVCGAGLILERRPSRHHGRFVCRKTRPGWHMQVPAEAAEAAVRDAVAALSADPTALEAMLSEAAALHRERSGGYQARRRELERAVGTAQARLDRLTNLLLDGTVNRQAYLQQQPRLEQDQRAARAALAGLVAPPAFDPAPLRAMIARMPELVRTGSPAAVHEALRLFIERVEVHVPPGRVRFNPDHLHIVWRTGG